MGLDERAQDLADVGAAGLDLALAARLGTQNRGIFTVGIGREGIRAGQPTAAPAQKAS